MSIICPIYTVALEKQANHCVFYEYLSQEWGSRKWLSLGMHSICWLYIQFSGKLTHKNEQEHVY